MAQQYTDEIAIARMKEGRCPECGDSPDIHSGLGGPACTLTDNGVADRIAYFKAHLDDKNVGAVADLLYHMKNQITKMDRKPSWDEWGLIMAHAAATRADCTRRKVGAVIMRPDGALIQPGYNGAPSGEPGCLTGACPRGASGVAPGSSYDTGAGVCIAVHAEQNVLLRASWADMLGSTLYCTDKPCGGCFRTIKGTPLARVVFPGGEIVKGLTNWQRFDL